MARYENLGFGIGLRAGHFGSLLEHGTRADWLEAISENFMIAGGRPLHVLEHVRRDKPLVLHGVSLSIGGTDPLDEAYLRELRALADRIEPVWVSDHLCWTGRDAHQLHDLLPLPWTEELLDHLVPRIARVQDVLGRRLVLENVSSYLAFEGEMTESQFLAELVRRCECDLLLDVNNVHVSAHNQGFDSRRYIDAIPGEHVAQIHLAGHRDHGTHLLDSHDAPIADAVLDLYRYAIARLGPVSTLVEWDGEVPPLDVVEEEALRARRAVGGEQSSPGSRRGDVAAA
ncbi:MAG: DUF692 domain-containing protein [Deltaproteobacteria bacterium]|nr:DUF692 domain-containing protein [Deltaproteobacteria bacterium]